MSARIAGLPEALQALASGRISATALTRQALDIAQAGQPTLNAFASIAHASALQAAAYSDRRYAAGCPRPLEGLPIGVKDLIDTQGLETRYGSAAYRGHVPSAHAQVVQTLVDQGAIIIGKTTTHEFAWGVTTASREFGNTLNPLDTHCIPGGSSGGAAAAIACGAIAAGLGTDTGGSVRIPAALCGVTGFKPTYGRFPTEGIFPLAPSLDHPGLLGAGVADVVLLARALGIALPDATSSVMPRFGVIRQIDPVPLSTEVAEAFERAVGSLARVHECVEVDSAGLFDGAFQAFANIVLTEGAVTHFSRHDWDFINHHYGAETVERLDRARRVEISDYASAQTVRRQLGARLGQVMDGIDYLLLPTCPCTAPRVDQATLGIGTWQGTVREALMTYTAPFNLAGFPAISIPLPCPSADGRLPAALQIVARPGNDGGLLGIALTLEWLLASR
ncbi:amidase, Asp-tRNAAsn/Glu-tRNAGln amidotransferase A subunit [Pseudomonas sp. GM78]|uniref:amidase n=1 Tax=Pseudomonas sp. GM78 TaxID=1144337 RepID=UPI000270B24C|nr:amidase [Pseudomonas sp. GM78]EJN22529.1 amidase, Asp-tRNAAsn/Glu-tRNAGln amidotransferase A subunit [Pseudomonas sp. GM78]